MYNKSLKVSKGHSQMDNPKKSLKIPKGHSKMDNPEKSLKIPKGHSKMDNPDINCQHRVHKIIGKQTQNVNKT